MEQDLREVIGVKLILNGFLPLFLGVYVLNETMFSIFPQAIKFWAIFKSFYRFVSCSFG